jgi:predicted HNH restriction endonuclease
MKNMVQLFPSSIEKEILGSILPGGTKWQFKMKNKQIDCKRNCPNYCENSGALCSDDWKTAKLNSRHSGILDHIIDNIEYYNQKDLDLKTKERINGIKLIKSKLIRQADEGESYKAEIRLRKRVPKLIAEKKLKSDGRCEACQFNFNKKYRNLSKNCLVAHHLEPIGSRKKQKRTTLNDLILLCPNCHAIIHSRKPPINIRKLIRTIKTKTYPRRDS